MKTSKYHYSFTSNNEFVIYFYINNIFLSFSNKDKIRVERIIQNPHNIVDNKDKEIFLKLEQSNVLLNDQYNEFRELISIKNKRIFSNDSTQLTIMPTLKCNFNCHYCFEQSKNNRMSDNTISYIAKELYRNKKNNKNVAIRWFGGEALLELDTICTLNNFVNELQTKNGNSFDSMVTTNGYLLTDEVQKRLINANIDTIDVTFDGSEITHNKIRFEKENKKSFSIILKNIFSFLDKNIENSAIVRFQIHSFDNKELESILDTIYSFEPYKNRVFFYFRCIFSNCLDSWSENKSNDEIQKNNETNKKINILYSKIMSKGFSPAITGDKPFYCSYEIDSNWLITPDGNCHKCSVGSTSERAQGYLSDSGININRFNYNNFRTKDDFIVNNECKNCENLPLCWGGCQFIRYQSSLLNSKKFACKLNKKRISDENIQSLYFLEKFVSIKQTYKDLKCEINYEN